MAEVAVLARPARWDAPFDPDMREEDVAELLQQPSIAAIDQSRFPPRTPLSEIIRNDTRIVEFGPGEIVVRNGDYGSSAFLVLDGDLRVVISPSLPDHLLGRKVTRKRGLMSAFSQIFTNSIIAEARDTRLYAKSTLSNKNDLANAHVVLNDVPGILARHKTAQMTPGTLFGELAALGRVPRAATVFAEGRARLLEIRWQGLREIRKFDEGWRKMIDQRYRQNALKAHLQEEPIFAGLDEQTLQKVADATLFETYGSFDWHVAYKRDRSGGQGPVEPVIARQGDYPDGLLLIRAGLARVSVKLGTGRRTLTHLWSGDSFGLEELYEDWKEGREVALRSSLTALGYVDVLRVPTHVLESLVFPDMKAPEDTLSKLAERHLSEDAAMEWAVEQRFINGKKTMLIDTNRCVRCDDCVRACSATHGGNPRFIRHGKQKDHWMVANACMHCVDPVCMIGCPTGAIHRTIEGTVVINDITCIGCGTCANSCPYDNIRLVEIRDTAGRPVMDPDSQQPILKATKCDLCIEQPGGPACVRACPHDALRRVDFRSGMPFQENR